METVAKIVAIGLAATFTACVVIMVLWAMVVFGRFSEIVLTAIGIL